MSFILDAIAKSEQERQQQEVPQAQILASPLGIAQRTRRLLPYFIVGALILNAILVAIWMQSNQSDPANLPKQAINIVESPTEQPTTSEPEAVVEQAVTETQLIATDPQLSIAPTNEMSNSENKPEWIRAEPDTISNQLRTEEIETGPMVEKPDLVLRNVSRLSELPGMVRNDLPTIVFSGHLYSTNPDSSIVFVDKNRPVKKGQRIVDEVYLHEITATGVVVEFQGYLIDVGVLQNWTLN